MALSTVSAASQITPVVVGTFFRHFHRKLAKKNSKDNHDPTNDIIFDQAFHIVKKFMDICTHQDVESLQSFSNTHIPSPPWGVALPGTIPLSCCSKAADIIIDWFAPEELQTLVGGSRWWQVRGIDGIEAEWIAMRSHVGVPLTKPLGRESADSIHKGLSKLRRTVLFVHGGAFYWGSINTHRYQILRIARKIEGRCFAVNYRKAPQYPWPCAIQDVLAAYLFLIDPPPGASHTAIPPNEIVLAGDSAGGGLCLSLLTLIRDMSLPMPAGGVLISPWVDLTHSFPSVMDNTATDIIPAYGFIHKPSTCWPVSVAPGAEARVEAATAAAKSHTPTPTSDNENSPLPTQPESQTRRALKLASQIQIYATNEQLEHPLVSPLLQGSLGNLCPLYILAGEHEVLRDEIVYLAHRAAHPDRFPVRDALLRSSPRQEENIKRFTDPTKVRLQIYDGMPHVMTVYSFYPPVKYAYRAIANFVRHVCDPETSKNNQQPLSLNEAVQVEEGDSSDDDDDDDKRRPNVTGIASPRQMSLRKEIEPVPLPIADPIAPVLKSQSLPLESLESSEKRKASELSIPPLIAERVDLSGGVRALEAAELIPALQIPSDEIGIVKDTPAKRYMEGQSRWDKAFGRTAATVAKRRQRYRDKATALINAAKDAGLLDESGTPVRAPTEDEPHPRWWPLDLHSEKPPPSAIAGRTDTAEALSLLKGCLKSLSGGVSTVPTSNSQLNNWLRGAARTSPSEGQVYNRWLPVHGLKIWEGMIRVFAKETRKRTKRLKKRQARNSVEDSK